MKIALIIAPFWRQHGHVGNHRVERFVRWLAEDGCRVVLVRGGSIEAEQQETWGLEITVRDPLGLYRDSGEHGAPPPKRKPNRLRRSVAYWFFNPDPGVVWARQVCAHPAVLQHAAKAGMILSSSPPESAHVAAGTLSRQFGVPHVVDLRDGWLDEPIKPLLRSSRLRRWLEGRLEHALLKNATSIFVTSEEWRKLLCQRLPALAWKVVVLTNGYPPFAHQASLKPALTGGADKRLEIIHAGQFSGSDPSRVPDLLLRPLVDGIRRTRFRGVLQLIGTTNQVDRNRIKRFESALDENGWTMQYVSPVPRDKLLKSLGAADGLLLLSTSNAAIPSKLFEYIAARRPILAVTGRDSATWRICERISFAYRVDTGTLGDVTEVIEFLRAASTGAEDTVCPEEFSERALSATFRIAVRGLREGG